MWIKYTWGGKMENLKEILKMRNNLLKYLRKIGSGKRNYNLMDTIILTSVREDPDLLGRDLSREMEIDSAYITRDIGKLEKRNLIRKRKRGREKVLDLTRSGSVVAERIAEENDRFMEELRCRVGEESVETSLRVLREANKLIEERLM